MDQGTASARYLPGPRVRERYGISESTFWRWENDPAMGFPKPLRVGRKKLYRETDLQDWERQRVARAG